VKVVVQTGICYYIKATQYIKPTQEQPAKGGIMKVLQVRINDDLHETVKELAKKERRSVSNYVATVLEERAKFSQYRAHQEARWEDAK
jgi:predicted HicB family RNase H-like nuclease